MPLSCKARRFDERSRGTLDDTLGGYMLTLVDTLDTLIVLKEFELFKIALQKVSSSLSFSNDANVSVFEVNIRLIGGLLSAHQLALHVFDDGIYDGFTLLNMANDIASRIIPAFQTNTGIPIHRINLKNGLILNEERRTCTAAGGSYLLEMGLLSRLTGNASFEAAAYKALKALWGKRSKLDLVGSLIDTATGTWVHPHSGIGAGIDSFFETMLKSAILLGDSKLLEWFEVAYAAVEKQTVFNVNECFRDCACFEV